MKTPLDTITTLVAARARGDVKAALACYEPTATLVFEPGKTGSGKEALEGFIAATLSLPLVFGRREIVVSGSIALHCCEWTAAVTDDAGQSADRSGRTADILRQQADGTWQLVVDNPWGTAILDAK